LAFMWSKMKCATGSYSSHPLLSIVEIECFRPTALTTSRILKKM
jgi:hypothetical protein